ncbi:MAG: hypothetical protein QM518_07525 [Verrucomicrobiota bacterium]|nr:hypothetical protein [Verrucomicrobiota bacterium]
MNVLFVNIPRRITRSIDSETDTDSDSDFDFDFDFDFDLLDLLDSDSDTAPDSKITPDWAGW